MPPEFVPSNDNDVISLVRGLTDYSDVADEIPREVIQEQLDVAKLRIYNYLDDSDLPGNVFYDDAGLGQALVGATAIYAKASIENYSVSRYRIGDQEIETSQFNNPDGAQFEFWNELVNEGLDASSYSPSHEPRNTSAYIGENR